MFSIEIIFYVDFEGPHLTVHNPSPELSGHREALLCPSSHTVAPVVQEIDMIESVGIRQDFFNATPISVEAIS